ncbi:MAG TPA: hypothetical protein VND91_07530 [Candidatus Saccharimonadia bacterium]|nr:hypothetical protein [Candidatus Saccharimonadia bacterium]
MTLRFLLAALTVALGCTAPAHAVRDVSGQTPGGAYFRIVAPDDWVAGGPLVLYQHGFDFDPPMPNPSLGPILDIQLSQGYAVAASSYSQRGWALFTALDDNAELLARFTQEFGAPGEIVAFGGSMGGLISLKLAEDPRFAARTRSVFSLCPAAAGAQTWDYAFDLRLIYDDICEGVGGGELQQGDAPHTFALNLDQIPPNLDNLDNNPDVLRALARVTQCTGLALPADFRTFAQRGRLTELMRRSGIGNEDFLATNLAYSAFAMSDLVRAPDKLGGRSPFDSLRATYAPGERASDFPALRADPFARFDLAVASSLAGTGTARIISLHTSRDELVVPAHQAYLRARYPADRLVSAIVTEAAPTHCSFTPAEGLAGWEALRAWTRGGARPSVADLRTRCIALEGAGIAGPCRIDPAAQIDGQVAATRSMYATVPAVSGVWFDPARSGEGIVIEELDDAVGWWRSGAQRVLVSWFTFDPAGEPLWIVGQGGVYGDNAVLVRDAYVARGRGFASSGVATRTRWGRIDLEFSGTPALPGGGLMRIRWNGVPGYGSGTLAYRQATPLGIGDPLSSRGELVTATPPPFTYGRSGTYIVDGRDGDGVILQESALIGGGQPTRALSQLVWYTFDPRGAPLWLVGAAFGADRYAFDVYRARGTPFGAGFDPDDVERVLWGRVELEVRDCDVVALRYRSNDPAYGEGRVTTRRLSRPPRIGGCGT